MWGLGAKSASCCLQHNKRVSVSFIGVPHGSSYRQISFSSEEEKIVETELARL